MRPKIASLKFLCRSADRPLFSPVTARKIPLSNDIRVETVKYRNTLTRKDLWAMSAINFRAPPCFVCRISAVGSGSSAQVREQLGQCQAVLAQPGSAGEVDRDELRDAALGHRHPKQPVDARHR